jgi:hypothetical protein
MPEKLTEAQARRVCEALGYQPDGVRYRAAEDWPDCKQAEGWYADLVEVPTWRIVQRAAEEEKP